MKLLIEKSQEIGQRLNNCSDAFVRGFEEMNEQLEVKPELQLTLDKLERHDEALQGREICQLADAADKGDMFTNKREIEHRKESMRQAYIAFLRKAYTLTNEFIKEREELLGDQVPHPRKIALLGDFEGILGSAPRQVDLNSPTNTSSEAPCSKLAAFKKIADILPNQ